jgi:predicted nuclease of predicted toxin-antitoxin system
MPRTIRFHLDEYVNPAVADGLRRRGINVTTTPGAGLLGADDTAHFAFAAAERRVIFTNDADFLRMHDQGVDHPGIVYCQQQNHSVGEIIRALELIWEVLEPDEMADRVEFV